jgi:O-antigen/teichoic acid export membrane protein
MKTALLNLLYRGLGMAGRFVILIGVGKYLSVPDLGIYGLFSASIVITLYFIGFDFYTFNTRELITCEKHKRLALIRDQLLFHLLSYIPILPLLLLIFYKGVVPFHYILWFYIILIAEHFSQEFYRIFTALSETVFANLTSFIRSGLWVYVLVLFWIYNIHSFKNLNTVFVFWACSSLSSVLLSAIYLFRLDLGTSKGILTDWKWIGRGIKTSMPFFISTLAYKVVEYSNRYFLDFFGGKTEVGIFTFYAGISNLINVVIFTAIIMVLYPQLYRSYHNKQYPEYRIKLHRFSWQVCVLSIVLGLLMALPMPWLLNVIGKKEIYGDSLGTYYLLIAANVILNISLIPHYMMYIKRLDKLIMNITLLGAVVNLTLNYFLIGHWGMVGAAGSMVLCLLLILILKYYYRGHNSDAAV